ncbi:MAG TPA: helix-turn-helix domain-containing protein [Solirubrobacteraceae bacterium]|nr:helix-turn-helix domain-containing protein [Solirubrobacteraceae bacterium]
MTVIHHNGAFMESLEPPLLSEPLLTADDAAELLRVRRSTVYELARTRRLPHVRVGRRILFVRSDLAAWVVANRVLTRP